MNTEDLFLPRDLVPIGENRYAKQNYTGKYKPEIFWNEMGKVYLEIFLDENGKFKKDYLQLNMENFVKRLYNLEPKKVLEVGCGFGRCLTFANENVKCIERLEGIEFSPTMIEKSKSFLKRFDKKGKIRITQADARDIPYKDKEFDLIYTHVCLTHIRPIDIPKVVSEISRVSAKWIIHIERFAFPYEHANPHRWSHLLVPMYLDLGWAVHEHDILNKKHYTRVLTLKRGE